MQRTLSAALMGIAVAMSGACNQEIAGPTGEIMLESIDFLPAEAGKPLMLVARSSGGETVARQPVLLRSSRSQQQGWLIPLVRHERSPYDRFSDAELAAIIEAYDRIVMVGFKEAEAEAGVDDEGRSTTSKETVERMKEWIQEQGGTITREWSLTPGVTATMRGEPELVGVIRRHPNIDYLEPGGIPGEAEGGSVRGPDFLGVFLTSDGSATTAPAGAVVTAEYRQPNGSVLQATVTVR